MLENPKVKLVVFAVLIGLLLYFGIDRLGIVTSGAAKEIQALEKKERELKPRVDDLKNRQMRLEENKQTVTGFEKGLLRGSSKFLTLINILRAAEAASGAKWQRLDPAEAAAGNGFSKISVPITLADASEVQVITFARTLEASQFHVRVTEVTYDTASKTGKLTAVFYAGP